MFDTVGLTTARILDVFTSEVSARGGRVTDTFDDGRRLLTRSVLGHADEARPGDKLRGGIALKAIDSEVWLYPYVFRLVCQNGAIIAQTIEANHLVDLHLLESECALESIREGIEACCREEVFANVVGRMRIATRRQADLALNIMPLLSRLPAESGSAMLGQIMNQFFREGDKSLFGLANAVTATARDTRDPELKWDLEEFGGGLAIATSLGSPRRSSPSAVRPPVAVAVG